MTIALAWLKIKVRGQGQIYKVKVKGRNAHYFTLSLPRSIDCGQNPEVQRWVRIRIWVRNAVSRTSIVHRGQFSSFVYIWSTFSAQYQSVWLLATSRLNGSYWFLRRAFFSAFPTPCCTETRGINENKVDTFLCNFSQTLDLEKLNITTRQLSSTDGRRQFRPITLCVHLCVQHLAWRSASRGSVCVSRDCIWRLRRPVTIGRDSLYPIHTARRDSTGRWPLSRVVSGGVNLSLRWVSAPTRPPLPGMVGESWKSLAPAKKERFISGCFDPAASVVRPVHRSFVVILVTSPFGSGVWSAGHLPTRES